jgi:hypothetical protein
MQIFLNYKNAPEKIKNKAKQMGLSQIFASRYDFEI